MGGMVVMAADVAARGAEGRATVRVEAWVGGLEKVVVVMAAVVKEVAVRVMAVVGTAAAVMAVVETVAG